MPENDRLNGFLDEIGLDANAETADDWLKSFSFARNQLI